MKAIRFLAFVTAAGACSLVPCASGQSSFARIHDFQGESPIGLTAHGGVLYGSSYDGHCGTVFQLQPPAGGSVESAGAWTESVLYTFTGINGDACGPLTPLAVGPLGVIYGTSIAGGGIILGGTVFELEPPTSPDAAWTEKVLHSFSGPDGTTPFTGVVRGLDGALYGTASGGGTYDSGCVFRLDPPAAPGGAWIETVLYDFPQGYAAGAVPVSLTLGDRGVLYGATELGGRSRIGAGTVFQLSPPTTPGGSWTETVLHSFTGFADGSTPYWPAVGSDGTIYGTTFGTTLIGGYEGPYGFGTVFQLLPQAEPGGTWAKTTLHQFGWGRGFGPDSPLILRNGNIFGTVSLPAGGAVFELQPPSTPGGAWNRIILHLFTNGQTPYGALVMDESGALYGSTKTFPQPSGTVYRIKP
jgi:uncharacterized repeat protein (TIGR03803 family)